jgi:single-strand DNA-binding protein
MAKSVNKVVLLGHIGKDPDVRYTPSGTALAKFSLATNEAFKDKSGEWQERTEWHNVVAWQRLAEIVGEYVHKGTRAYVEGRLQTSSWNDRQSGETRHRTEIVAREIVLLGGPREEQQNGHAVHSSPGATVVEEPERDFATASQISDEDIPF